MEAPRSLPLFHKPAGAVALALVGIVASCPGCNGQGRSDSGCPSPASIAEGESCSTGASLSCPSAETRPCCGATSGTGTVQFCSCLGHSWVCSYFCDAVCPASTDEGAEVGDAPNVE
jgi:hypothetical protein